MLILSLGLQIESCKLLCLITRILSNYKINKIFNCYNKRKKSKIKFKNNKNKLKKNKMGNRMINNVLKVKIITKQKKII